MDIQDKVASFQKALRELNEHPFTLASLLKLPPIDANTSAAAASPNRISPPSKISHKLTTHGEIDWSGVFSAWVNATRAAQAGFPTECYEHQAALHKALNQVIKSSPGNIIIPTLHAVCKSTHRAAVAADAAAAARNNTPHDHSKLQSAVTLLQDSYSRTINDRKELIPDAPYNGQDGSKKAGVLLIVNELFAIYFSLNTLRLCRNLQQPVETKKLHLEGAASMGQLVTYRYYVGRINLFEDKYEAAEENLEYAFDNCHKDAVHNKRCILRYLVPVKVLRGRLPSAQLLAKYRLTEFSSLVESIRKGDLRTFNDHLIKYQHRFISQGTYLLLEKCKVVCYRNLFKRIHLVLEKTQISLGHVANAFKWLGMPIDLDEVECILANLIYRGYVRGYLSHSKRMLVLSRRDPFPVAAVILNKQQ